MESTRRNIKNRLSLFIALSSITVLSAQDVDSEQESFYEGQVSKMVNVPNSPEAQAFAKYGDTEVSLYTGVPQIGVPLHTIQGREMDLSVSLTYDASGIKVEQMATPVGLGWNLQVGGRISRMVNGLPDDYQTGQYATIYNNVPSSGGRTAASGGASIKNSVTTYVQNQYIGTANPVFSSQVAAEDYFDFLYDVSNNFIDTQPDYFSLNVPGISETIVIDYTDGYVAKALQNPRIQITPNLSSNVNAEILGWTVVAENGTVYEFDIVEYTQRQHTNDNTVPQGDYNTTFGSSWVLTKITSPNGKDVFEFAYNNLGFWPQAEAISSASVATLTIENNPNYSYPIPPHTFKSGIVSNTEQQLLSSVSHRSSTTGVKRTLMEMGFANRQDSQNTNNSRYASITFYEWKGKEDPESDILKRIEFENDAYFNLDGLDPSQKNYDEIRLKLDGIAIKGRSSVIHQTYAFDYERPDALPPRVCTGQDYFGYYNGKSCDQSLYEASSEFGLNFPGGNRQPNSYHGRTGILNKITYPTKGYSIFNYEGHKSSGGDIGGIRIASISDYANTGVAAQTKTYSYSDATVNYEPNITILKNPTAGSVQPVQLVRYAAFPKGNEPYVTYDTVTERRLDNNGQDAGSTVFRFFNDGSKGLTPSLNAPFENRFSGNLEKGNLQESYVTGNGLGTLSRTTNEYHQVQQVIDVPGLVVYADEALQNQWLFFDIQPDNSVNTIRIDASPCFLASQGGPATSGGVDVDGIFWSCSCFTSTNSSCGQISEGIYNALRAKKTQALGRYGGVNKVISEQTLVDGNGTTQVVTTTQDITFTDQEDVQGMVPSNDVLYLPRKIRVVDSKGDTYETIKHYPTDNIVTGSSTLIAKNNLVEEVKVVTVKDRGNADPLVISDVESTYGSTSVMMPTSVATSKDGISNERAIFTFYANGNLKTAKQPNGPTTVYVWGYDDRYPVAKIENSSIGAVEALSLFGIGFDLGEGGLTQNQEDQLRGIANALVTTYTYDPLVGVLSITDYREKTTTFKYDDFNRLQWVKDDQGNLVSDYDYRYATPIQN